MKGRYSNEFRHEHFMSGRCSPHRTDAVWQTSRYNNQQTLPAPYDGMVSCVIQHVPVLRRPLGEPLVLGCIWTCTPLRAIGAAAPQGLWVPLGRAGTGLCLARVRSGGRQGTLCCGGSVGRCHAALLLPPLPKALLPRAVPPVNIVVAPTPLPLPASDAVAGRNHQIIYRHSASSDARPATQTP